MPSTHKLFKCFEGFTYFTAIDLNMGFWTIPASIQTFAMPVHDHLGESNVTSIFQWDQPVHWTYTKRKCQNYLLT